MNMKSKFEQIRKYSYLFYGIVFAFENKSACSSRRFPAMVIERYSRASRTMA